ncbi:MAG: hypothetical protein IPP17_24805 [Bacteroidetes bacterium]|nr:hypothetical protein [Bacteroidota bacterium]
MDVKVINGNEEASLIFEGVCNGVQMPPDQDVLVLDIGGGSVEFIVARDSVVAAAQFRHRRGAPAWQGSAFRSDETSPPRDSRHPRVPLSNDGRLAHRAQRV